MRRLLLLLLLAASSLLHAQTTEEALAARLLNKPLYLRGLWLSDKLHFDAAGTPTNKPEPGSFTLAGIEIDHLLLQPGHLQLQGRRFGLEFSPSGYKRVQLVRAPRKKDPIEIVIHISAPPSGDYGPALDAIFAPELADLVPTLPSYWQSYATTHLLHPGDAAVPVPSPPLGVYKIGGGVTPPKVLKSSEPQYSKYARAQLVAGNSLIYLRVDKEGKPTELRIQRPVGLGLDEQALEAVQKYVFAPAMRDGIPVEVELNVDVSFQIF
ncbi:energy transducer TonB [Granulicella sp. WH15]|uniref:energy transducer TonB n=1 Tax=Granulicella sp. WH15 TaxID=2602070 RepID=UPI00136690E7|nr:energy transducer TonB [Granulicella sp. WH15]QHN02158.1 energy transducer TonB [Granulicella sp. WH15]